MAGSVFWTGNDGNVWFKDSLGVRNVGRPTNISDEGFDTATLSAQSRRINNPSDNSVLADSTVVDRSDGGSGRTYDPLDQAGVSATQNSINQLGGILSRALAASQTGYENASRQLDAQEAQQRQQYGETALNNQRNYDANLMASIRAGGQGLAGLRSALGGGGGSGNQFAQDWVQRVVGDTTSNDIREGYETFDENRRASDSALSTFLTGLGEKRRQNEDTLANNRMAAENEYATQNQRLLQQMAGYYSDAGNTGRANELIGQSSGYSPEIARTSGRQVSAYNASPVAVSAPDMTAFSTPEKQAMSADDGRQGQGVFSVLDPRRREKQPAGA